MELENLETASRLANEYRIIKDTLELLKQKSIKVTVKITEADDDDDVIVVMSNGVRPYLTQMLSQYKTDIEGKVAAL